MIPRILRYITSAIYCKILGKKIVMKYQLAHFTNYVIFYLYVYVAINSLKIGFFESFLLKIFDDTVIYIHIYISFVGDPILLSSKNIISLIPIVLKTIKYIRT